MKGATHNLNVRTRTDVALYVLNHKRGHLRDLENSFKVALAVVADASVSGQQSFIIDRGEQVHTLEAAKALLAAQAAAAPSQQPQDERSSKTTRRSTRKPNPRSRPRRPKVSPTNSRPVRKPADDGDGQRRGKRRRRRRGRGAASAMAIRRARVPRPATRPKSCRRRWSNRPKAARPTIPLPKTRKATSSRHLPAASRARTANGGHDAADAAAAGVDVADPRTGSPARSPMNSSPPPPSEAASAVADFEGRSEPAPSLVQPEPVAPSFQPEPPEQVAPPAAPMAPQPSAAEDAAHEAEKATRRRSTVREKVSFTSSPAPAAATVPAAAEQPAPASAPEEPATDRRPAAQGRLVVAPFRRRRIAISTSE